MFDRETVIQGLEFTKEMILFNPLTGGDKDPEYLIEEDKITYDACVGAIALLKEQEPVKPISYYHGLDRPFTYRCGYCFHSLKDGDHFCSGCGKEIDWE